MLDESARCGIDRDLSTAEQKITVTYGLAVGSNGLRRKSAADGLSFHKTPLLASYAELESATTSSLATIGNGERVRFRSSSETAMNMSEPTAEPAITDMTPNGWFR